MPVRVAINGFGRIGRLVLRAILESGRDGHRGRRHQRSGPGGNQRPSAALRFRPRHLPRRGQDQGRRHRCRARLDDGDRRARSGEAALGQAQRRCGAGMHRHLHRPREGRGPSEGRRQAGADLRAGDQCRSDGGLWRQPRQAGEEPHHRLQRLLHDQLPGARRRGAAQGGRHRAWIHDHDPQLYRRPAGARHPAQGSLSRPRRGALDDPDHHGGGQGRRPRPAGAGRQARRHARSACRRPMSR